MKFIDTKGELRDGFPLTEQESETYSQLDAEIEALPFYIRSQDRLAIVNHLIQTYKLERRKPQEEPVEEKLGQQTIPQPVAADDNDIPF
jgi:hypothetical protein